MRMALLIFVCFLPISLYADWFGPKNYDDCILESMKGVSSDRAATAINRACRNKFPESCLKSVDFEGRLYSFPCNATDAEISEFLAKLPTGNPFGDVVSDGVEHTPKSEKNAKQNDFSIVGLLGNTLATAISALILGLFAFFMFKLGSFERRRNLRKALASPDNYPKWKKEGIRYANDHLHVIEKHFAGSYDRVFTQNELDGLSVFSYSLKDVFEQNKARPIGEVIKTARDFVEKMSVRQ